jgi:hypothetical protein
MPARKKPVLNLKINKFCILPSRTRIRKLLAAPARELNRKIDLGEYLSEIVRVAEIKVPTIKPNCTDEDIHPRLAIPKFQDSCMSGRIALPANQSEVPANCEKTITGSIHQGRAI